METNQIVPQQMVISQAEVEPNPAFIESNTNDISVEELTSKCIVPCWSDSTPTISHQTFIQTVYKAACDAFPTDEIAMPEIRVSHPINGRIPSALHKKKEELLENEKTLFYQRMCFCILIPSMSRSVNGQTVNITIGGVRAYNEQNLYSKRGAEKFKIFIGARVKVCSNLMLTCDGLKADVEAMSLLDIYQTAREMFSSFNPDRNISMLENLSRTIITDSQFCHILGRFRLYEALSPTMRKSLPDIQLGDSMMNNTAKGYLWNKNFGSHNSGYITCWEFLQLLNEAAKSAYIDTFLERNQNATDIALGIQKAIEGVDDTYKWFLE